MVNAQKYLLCIPTYNEKENIVGIIERVRLAMPSLAILVIDDNSPDGTADLVTSQNFDNVRILSRSKKMGLGPAYIAGFNEAIKAGYQFVIEMDADGSHQPEQLPALLEASMGAELVLGTRWMAGGEVSNWPKHRRAISRAGTWYAKSMLRLPYKDLTGGYRVISTSLLEKINLGQISTVGYGFQIEIAMRAHDLGAKIAEVPITFIERTMGRSKMSKAIVLEAIVKCTEWSILALFNRR